MILPLFANKLFKGPERAIVVRVICDTNGGGEGEGDCRTVKRGQAGGWIRGSSGERLIKEASKGITVPEKCRTGEKKGGT
jgi:hypothetical protein